LALRLPAERMRLPRGSTSLSATLLKLHRTAAFSAVLAATRNAASDLLHPAVGEEQVIVSLAERIG
jgi:hypothetical protein